MSLITVFPNLLPPPAILTKKMPQIIFSVSISSLRQKKSESPHTVQYSSGTLMYTVQERKAGHVYTYTVQYTVLYCCSRSNRTDRLGFHTEIQIILFTVLNMY